MLCECSPVCGPACVSPLGLRVPPFLAHARLARLGVDLDDRALRAKGFVGFVTRIRPAPSFPLATRLWRVAVRRPWAGGAQAASCRYVSAISLATRVDSKVTSHQS